MWSAIRHAIAFALILSATQPVRACLNDRELPSVEREFRSSYTSERYTHVSPVAAPRVAIVDYVSLAGASMLAAAGVIAWFATGRRTDS